ncbi:hypothetical protein Ancab_001288 [Ancistrocladus abbreviatus]
MGPLRLNSIKANDQASNKKLMIKESRSNTRLMFVEPKAILPRERGGSCNEEASHSQPNRLHQRLHQEVELPYVGEPIYDKEESTIVFHGWPPTTGRTRIEMARSPRPRCCHCCGRITYLVPTRAKKEKVGKKPSPKSSRGDKPHFKGKQSKGDKSKDKEKAIATDAKEQSQGRTPECFLRR